MHYITEDIKNLQTMISSKFQVCEQELVDHNAPRLSQLVETVTLEAYYSKIIGSVSPEGMKVSGLLSSSVLAVSRISQDA